MPGPPRRAPPPAGLVHWLRRGGTLLVLLAVLDYLVLPQIAGTRRALNLLGSVKPGWLVAGVALEAGSLLSYSLLTRSVLPGNAAPFSQLLRSDLTALGVSHLLPGGAAASDALRYRLLRESGAPAEDAAVGIAVQSVGSTVVLAGLLWLSLLASLGVYGVHPLYAAPAGVGALLLTFALVGILGHAHHPAPTAAPLRRLTGQLPRRIRPRVEHAALVASLQLRELLSDPAGLRRTAMWATGNWLLDAASLWVFLAAYGHRADPVGLLVGYGIATLVGGLPVSPGGLGVVEGILIPSLVGFGTPRAAAVLAVVSWRLFEFWAPIPLAGVCFASLRTRRWSGRPVPP